MSNNERPAYERTKLVLEINHLTKKFAVDGGKFLTACNDINLRAYEGRTLASSVNPAAVRVHWCVLCCVFTLLPAVKLFSKATI